MDYYGSVNYDINSGLLAHETTSCWYVDALQAGTASVGMSLQFDNGQIVSIAAVGQFTVVKPTTTFVPIYHGTPNIWITNGFLALKNHDMSFKHSIQSDFSGLAGYIQLISGSVTRDETVSTVGYELDNAPYARGQQTINNTEDTSLRRAFFYDAPSVGVPISTSNHGSMNYSYETYLLFKPDAGPGPNIFVPLRLVTWGLTASTTFNNGWTVDPGSSTSGPTDHDSTGDFPVWTGVSANGLIW